MKKKIFLLFAIIAIAFNVNSNPVTQLPIERPDEVTAYSLLKNSMKYRDNAEYAQGAEYGYEHLRSALERIPKTSSGYLKSDYDKICQLYESYRAVFLSLPRTSYNDGVLAGYDAAYSDKLGMGGAL